MTSLTVCNRSMPGQSFSRMKRSLFFTKVEFELMPSCLCGDVEGKIEEQLGDVSITVVRETM